MTDFNEDALRQALKDNHTEIKGLIEKANEEAKSAGSVAKETKTALDALTKQSHEIDQRLVAIEQRDAERGTVGERKTIGQQVAASQSFQDLLEGRSRAASFEIKTTLTNATINTSQPLVPVDYVERPQILPYNDPTVWDVLPKGQTASNIVAFPRATRTNNAGPQVSGSPLAYTEGATKPESAYSFSQVTRPVQTIAHFLPVSTQIMEDVPYLESWLQVDMLNGLRDELQDQCLAGSGAKGNLSGLITEATAFAAESPQVASATNVVTIRSAMRQLEVSNYRASHIVLHPTDWYRMEVERINPGTDDRYIWSNPQNANDRRLWGVPVIVTNAMTEGTYLVGDMMQAMVYERSGISFAAAYQDASNFRQNLVTLRAECRLALIVKRTEAFVTGALA